MAYYLKLSDTEIPRVSKIEATPFYRSETRQTTLSGGLAVDRGDLKRRFDITVRAMTAAEFKVLEALLDDIVITVQLYYRNELKTYSVVADPVASANEIYLYGDQEKGVVYTDIKFTLEEQ